MVKLNKEQILEEVEKKYDDSAHDEQIYSLADEAIDLAQQWIDENEDKIPEMTHMKLRLAIRKHVRSNMNFTDTEKSYFVPSFVWAWLAQQVIMWIVRYIINNYIEDYSDNNK